MSDFAAAVNNWCLKVPHITDEAARKAVVRLCTRIINDTPIDERRPDEVVARGDWNSAVGTEPGDVERNDPSGFRALDGLEAVVAQWNPSQGEAFYFANYKDYIERIEYIGWGGTPPYGMMARHCIEWEDIVEEVLREGGE